MFRNETKLKKISLAESMTKWYVLNTKIFSMYVRKGSFSLKKSLKLFIRNCKTFIFQRLFSEFDYLNYFLSYIVNKCCKRDESYCILVYRIITFISSSLFARPLKTKEKRDLQNLILFALFFPTQYLNNQWDLKLRRINKIQWYDWMVQHSLMYFV